MKFIRDIISERRSQKPAGMALPEAAVLPPPLADLPLRRSEAVSGDAPLPLPQRQVEPSRAETSRVNIFAEAEAMEDFAVPDFDEETLAPVLAATAVEDPVEVDFSEEEAFAPEEEAEDPFAAPEPREAADDPFDRLRAPAGETRAEAFTSQRNGALRLERPILSPREPASLTRSPFADLRGATSRASDPRPSEPRQAEPRLSEPRQAEPRQAEPRFEAEPPLRRPATPEAMPRAQNTAPQAPAPHIAAPQMAAPQMPAHQSHTPHAPAPQTAAPAAAPGFVSARAVQRAEDLPEPDAFEVPPPAAGRGANRSGRVKTRLLGFNPDGMGLADPFEKPQAQANPAFPVAWLVVVSGPGRGASFSLHDGVSRIGRGEDQTVPLAFGDTSISRENHAAIAYDAEQNAFFVGQSGKANIVRLNNKPLLSTEQLTSGDQIRLGETTLRFVALCGPEFHWNRQG